MRDRHHDAADGNRTAAFRHRTRSGSSRASERSQNDRAVAGTRLRAELENRVLGLFPAALQSVLDTTAVEKEIEASFLDHGEDAFVALVGLLRESSGDPANPNLEVDERNDLVSEAMAKVLVKVYREGRIADLGRVIGSLQVFRNLDPDSIGRSVASDVYRCLRQTGDAGLIERAFVEMCDGNHRLHSGFGFLAENAGQAMGYENAMMAVHLDQRIGEEATDCAVRALISSWVWLDPVACSTYVRNLPECPQKAMYLAGMVSALAAGGRMEEAREWLAVIPPDSRYRADAVERMEWAISRSGTLPPGPHEAEESHR